MGEPPGSTTVPGVIWIYVSAAVVGLAVLALMSVRVWRQLRLLMRTMSAASASLAAAGAALEQAEREGGGPASPTDQ